MNYLDVANDPMLWAMVIPMVGLVGVQAFLFIRKSYASASIVDLTRQDCNKALRVGATAGIGPSLSVFVVMVAMMGVIGGPITWQRLSMIGAANTELTASTLGAEAMGVEFGGADYGIVAFANSVWAMTLNGCGWLLFCGLFTDKLGVLQEKVSGGDPQLIQHISGAAVLGTASFLVALNTRTTGGGVAPDSLTAAIIAAASMIIFGQIAKRIPIINEYSLGLSMIIGMGLGVVVFNMMGGA